MITYGRMRHDPKLRAVLQALTLPILRATWALDPAGCRPEVVALVSEDLGLMVKGKDPVSTGARRRGVIWSRHLREALFSLIYGHMPFERRYDVTSGQARLVNLGPRMPWTIAQMNLNDASEIQNIHQTTQRDPIPGNRLVWYSYGQEGANWAGISVLRPAFGAWLLKHEMWRVLATSNRRFGMGIPVVEAPPGATREMVTEAQALASSMRVGDQTGVGIPQGYTYHLEGLTGSVPDSLEFIRYLDQQMAGMALAGVLELGTTETGSRALGESFLDLFLLALQSLADEVALTATSGQPGMPGIVVDLVDQNWGPEEPAPQVICLDVGESYSITAEALGILSQFGLLGPDANIDDWIRKKWGLPARAGVWRPTSRGIPAPGQPGGAFLPSGATPTPEADETGLADNVLPENRVPSWTPPVPAPAAPPPAGGGGPGPPGAQPPGGPVAGRKLRAGAGLRRELSDVEAASGFDPDTHQGDFTSRLDGLLKAWGPVSKAQREDIVAQVDAAVTAGALGRLAALSTDSSGGADLLEKAMTALAGQAADRMISEAKSQGVTIKAGDVKVDLPRVRSTAEARAALAASYVCQAAANKALQVAAAAGDGIPAIIDVFIDGLSEMSLRDQLAAALSAAQNQGRVAVLKAAPASAGKKVAYRASEILDVNVCDPCKAEDEHVFASLADAEAAYPNGGYLGCEGGLRCRGTVIANWGGVTRVS